MSSILTNTSAMSALQTLTQTQRDLQTTQGRISSGLRIADASDNAAYWSIATTMKSDNGALSAVKDALNLGASTIDTANAALKNTEEVVNAIKQRLVTASQPGMDRAKIQLEISAFQAQLQGNADGAAFSGQNWLSVDSSAAGYNATKSIVGSFVRDASGAVAVSTIDIDTAGIKLYDANDQSGILDKDRTGSNGTTETVATIDISALTDSATDLDTLADYLQIVDAALLDLTTASSDLGASKQRVNLQQSFVGALTDAIEKGVGALVDADMNRESTRLQALQVQQQLGVQSLSIANQNSQLILKLFG